MIRDVAFIPVQAGREAEFEAVFAKRRARVLVEEPNTLIYDLYLSDAGPGLYVVYESFTSPEAREFHLKNSTDHLPMMACFAGKPTVHHLRPIATVAD